MESTRDIFFARHGETDWNRQARWQGQTDIPLNELGRDQARRLGESLRGVPIARIEASDLIRAAETARLAAEVLGHTVAGHHVDLRERSFGVFEGLTRKECELRYPEAWERYREDHRQMPPGAEVSADLVARMAGAVDRLARIGLGEGPLLIVGHGGAIRSLLSHAIDAPLPPIENGAVYRARWMSSPDAVCVLREIALFSAL